MLGYSKEADEVLVPINDPDPYYWRSKVGAGLKN